MSDLHAESFYFSPQSYYEEYKQTSRIKACCAIPCQTEKYLLVHFFVHYYYLSARERGYLHCGANNLTL